ncbi:MAG: ECF-type sigma factor [Verrucomicrobiota bacterium]|nr:ECF-type sigma factor [Verrucomicrobiota bacterium]
MSIPGEGTQMTTAPLLLPPVEHSFGEGLAALRPEQYEALRELAAGYLRGERPDHTLQPTALVHEAFLRILKRTETPWQSREHLTAFAARAMRRILVTYGVSRSRQKRGGPAAVRLPLSDALEFAAERNLRLEEVDDALEQLERLDPRQAQIVEMRFFAGLRVEQIAAALRISPATVKREWATAKLWLRCALEE